MPSFGFATGQNSDIGAAAERLMDNDTADSIAEARAIFLKPKEANTGEIYLCLDGGDDTTGVEIPKSTGMWIEGFSSPRNLFVIATVAGEELTWMALTP